MFRPTKTSQASLNRQTYIPPHMEQAMAQHMQQTMPDHLKKYQGGYVPEHIEKAMTAHMQKSLPKHMQQYAGAYMEQRVINQAGSAPASVAPPSSAGPTPHAPTARLPRPDLTESDGDSPDPTAPRENYEPDPEKDREAQEEGPYSFITSSKKPSRPSPLSSLPGGNSTLARAGVFAGGLVILLIAFVVFRGLVNNSPDFSSFVTITQEQQEMIHLAANASKQPDLSTFNRNLAATMQLSLGSSQAKTIKYLLTNKQKIDGKVLNLKVSAATDKQLADAAAATIYNQTFQEVIQDKLSAYTTTLDQTFRKTSGEKGRTLLVDSYKQAKLMQAQLNESGNQ